MLKKIAATEKFPNFDLFYLDFDFQEGKCCLVSSNGTRQKQQPCSQPAPAGGCRPAGSRLGRPCPGHPDPRSKMKRDQVEGRGSACQGGHRNDSPGTQQQGGSQASRRKKLIRVTVGRTSDLPVATWTSPIPASGTGHQSSSAGVLSRHGGH